MIEHTMVDESELGDLEGFRFVPLEQEFGQDDDAVIAYADFILTLLSIPKSKAYPMFRGLKAYAETCRDPGRWIRAIGLTRDCGRVSADAALALIKPFLPILDLDLKQEDEIARALRREWLPLVEAREARGLGTDAASPSEEDLLTRLLVRIGTLRHQFLRGIGEDALVDFLNTDTANDRFQIGEREVCGLTEMDVLRELFVYRRLGPRGMKAVPPVLVQYLEGLEAGGEPGAVWQSVLAGLPLYQPLPTSGTDEPSDFDDDDDDDDDEADLDPDVLAILAACNSTLTDTQRFAVDARLATDSDLRDKAGWMVDLWFTSRRAPRFRGFMDTSPNAKARAMEQFTQKLGEYQAHRRHAESPQLRILTSIIEGAPSVAYARLLRVKRWCPVWGFDDDDYAPWIRAAQALRDRGTISRDVARFLMTWFVETASDRVLDADPELLAADAEREERFGADGADSESDESPEKVAWELEMERLANARHVAIKIAHLRHWDEEEWAVEVERGNGDGKASAMAGQLALYGQNMDRFNADTVIEACRLDLRPMVDLGVPFLEAIAAGEDPQEARARLIASIGQLAAAS